MTENEIFNIANPVSYTAQGCLQMHATIGDENAKRLLSVLDFPKTKVDFTDVELGTRVFAMNISMMEVRFKSINNLFFASGKKNYFDLPCGYTHRGLLMAEKDVRFVGADLPAVIEQMKPAVDKLLPENSKQVSYHVADVTNLDSLHQALQGVEGELFISTEGLLDYLSEKDRETFFRNIRTILAEHGGMLVTTDMSLNYKTVEKLIGFALEGIEQKRVEDFFAWIKTFQASSKSEIEDYYKRTEEELREYFTALGLRAERLPLKDYLPDTILGTANFTKEIQTSIRSLFESCYILKLTVASNDASEDGRQDAVFAISHAFTDGTLQLRMKGRLDSISTVEMLRVVNQLKGTVDEMEIDLSEVGYISSSGLRGLAHLQSMVGEGKCKITGAELPL